LVSKNAEIEHTFQSRRFLEVRFLSLGEMTNGKIYSFYTPYLSRQKKRYNQIILFFARKMCLLWKKALISILHIVILLFLQYGK